MGKLNIWHWHRVFYIGAAMFTGSWADKANAQNSPLILYVTSDLQAAGSFRKALASANMHVEVVTPQRLPSQATALEKYDSIFLSNIPAKSLSLSQMMALQTACHDKGVGFGMIGGENSFASGGYRGTPIEAMLPVTLDVKPQKHLPDLAVALVLEDIEVPNRQKDLAEFAAMTLNLLEAEDQFGALDCNGPSSYGKGLPYEGHWRAALQKITDRTGLFAKVKQVKEWGDPPTYAPYLAEAARTLSKTAAKIRHIILVGDGDAVYEGDNGKSRKLAKTLRAKGMTISTVATGADKLGIQFMADLAASGGGRAYWTENAQDFARITLSDLLALGQPLLTAQSSRVHSLSNQPLFADIDWSAAPSLMGYNRGELKPGADVSLLSEQNDPLCAKWQFGSGHAFAFMSQDRMPWGTKWLTWSQYSKFWIQAVQCTLRSAAEH